MNNDDDDSVTVLKIGTNSFALIDYTFTTLIHIHSFWVKKKKQTKTQHILVFKSTKLHFCSNVLYCANILYIATDVPIFVHMESI